MVNMVKELGIFLPPLFISPADREKRRNLCVIMSVTYTATGIQFRPSTHFCIMSEGRFQNHP